MKKVVITIEETLKYHREVTIKVPDEMTESDIDGLCTVSERISSSSSDIPCAIERNYPNVKILAHPDEDYSSPFDSDVEIIEYDIK